VWVSGLAVRRLVDSAIVKTAQASMRELGFGEPRLSIRSADSNVLMHLGIPAIRIGGGGRGPTVPL
jgi:hypothetical protein